MTVVEIDVEADVVVEIEVITDVAVEIEVGAVLVDAVFEVTVVVSDFGTTVLVLVVVTVYEQALVVVVTLVVGLAT